MTWRTAQITVRRRRGRRCVAPFAACWLLVFLPGLLEVDRALRTVPVILDALVEERLLAFEHELLVAQRADREPGQHEARHEHSQHEYKRDFLHWGECVFRLSKNWARHPAAGVFHSAHRAAGGKFPTLKNRFTIWRSL